MTVAGWTIREAAGKVGLSQDTLRYYERIKLVPPVGRDSSGYRRYTEEDLEWLVFVARLRATGMPIADIATFVKLALRGNETVPQRLELLEAHRQAVEAQWREVRNHLHLIQTKIGNYRRMMAATEGLDTGAVREGQASTSAPVS
ncbi:MerR family transcriptional regulator [Acrocarpospora phusangensis]|uniref:MerR family transcriptional regulator n=1 Tax=Acrocarpospora phusangensis TaxID=1070424 RepID=A0A919QG47_9ACTN|nr:MerR family transcriptional regulator [Acrocarpospora phusangensis]GIH25840.1 MerR family transcriptional regulator [Acrocarpospora phusangensis]